MLFPSLAPRTSRLTARKLETTSTEKDRYCGRCGPSPLGQNRFFGRTATAVDAVLLRFDPAMTRGRARFFSQLKSKICFEAGVGGLKVCIASPAGRTRRPVAVNVSQSSLSDRLCLSTRHRRCAPATFGTRPAQRVCQKRASRSGLPCHRLMTSSPTCGVPLGTYPFRAHVRARLWLGFRPSLISARDCPAMLRSGSGAPGFVCAVSRVRVLGWRAFTGRASSRLVARLRRVTRAGRERVVKRAGFPREPLSGGSD